MRVNTTASERMCRAGPPTAPEPHDVRGGTTRPLLRPPAAMLAQHCAASAAPPRGCVRASRRGRGSAARFTSAAVASTAAAAPPPPRITHARQAGVQLRRAGWSDVKAVAEARGAARPLLSLSCVCSRRAAAPPAVRRSLRRRAWEHTQGCARARAPLCCAARSTPRRRVARRQSQRGGPERVFGHQLPRRHVAASDQSHGAGLVPKGARLASQPRSFARTDVVRSAPPHAAPRRARRRRPGRRCGACAPRDAPLRCASRSRP